MTFARGRRLAVSTFTASLTALLTALALIMPASPANAGPGQAPSVDVAQTQAAIKAAQAELTPVYKYLSADLELDYAAASADPSVKRATLDDFSAGLIAGGGKVVGAGPAADRIAKAAERITASLNASILSCEGRNGWRNFWPTVFLDSCNASALSNLMNVGAGVAAIAALLSAATGAGAAVAGAIAAVLALYGSLLSLCNSWGHGVQIFLNPFGTPVCWSQ